MLGARSSAAEAVILRPQQTAALLRFTCPSLCPDTPPLPP